MSGVVSDSRNVYYVRDWRNDYKPEEKDSMRSRAERVALVALPFLALCRPLRPVVSLVAGTLRVWTHGKELFTGEKSDWIFAYQVFHTTVAVVALAGLIFAYPLCMLITTAQDILIELRTCALCLYHKNYPEALKSLVRIASSALYLTLLAVGGLELAIAGLALQAVVCFIASYDEFRKGRILEGCGNFLMAIIRLYQGYGQCKQLRRNREIEEQIRKIVVGELHEKWQFPSDHLPVGVEVNGVRIISWNVLNKAYMEWVTTKDSQGLNHSMISDLDVSVNESGLTQRDLVVVDIVSSMMKSGQIVALQECGEPFLKALQEKLPSDWEMVRSFDKPQVDQDVILYNKSALTYRPEVSEVTRSAYPSVPRRPLQTAIFSQGQGKQDLQIVNAHIPGDPNLPGREEFAEYVQKRHHGGIVTVALGDNNFERHEMKDAYGKAGFSEYSLHSPWQTNIDPYGKDSKAIDHIFIAGEHTSRDLMPSEVIPDGYNLQETIQLLRV